MPYSVTHGTLLSLDCGTGYLNPVGNAPGAYFTLLSSMFLHSGYLHIGGNMLFLFVFGDNIEARLGRPKFLALYFGAGLAGSLAVVATAVVAGGDALLIPGLGASGAISGVMAAYFVLYPNSRIISIVGYFVMPVRAVWFIGFWFLLQLLYQFLGLDTGVAYVAHLAGFAVGFVIALTVRSSSSDPDSA